jgi:hypothetical protein
VLGVFGRHQLLALVEDVGRKGRLLRTRRDGVLLAVAKVDDLVQEVVVVRLGL